MSDKITISFVEGDELPHRIRLDKEKGSYIESAGTTLEGAMERILSLYTIAFNAKFVYYEEIVTALENLNSAAAGYNLEVMQYMENYEEYMQNPSFESQHRLNRAANKTDKVLEKINKLRIVES